MSLRYLSKRGPLQKWRRETYKTHTLFAKHFCDTFIGNKLVVIYLSTFVSVSGLQGHFWLQVPDFLGKGSFEDLQLDSLCLESWINQRLDVAVALPNLIAFH